VRRTEVGVSTSYWITFRRSDRSRDGPEDDRVEGPWNHRLFTDTGSRPLRYAISLGVYRNEDGAKKRLALLRQRGVRSAQIGEREQRVTQTAFLVRDPTEAQSAQLANLKTDHPGSELRAVDCPPS